MPGSGPFASAEALRFRMEVPFDPGTRWSVEALLLRRGRRGFPVDATLDGVAF